MIECYDNRELSWLKFNERVLEEAENTSVPLAERLMFAAIYQSNLDEFFMVRVGSLHDQFMVDPEFRENKTGMLVGDQIKAIFERTKELTPRKDKAYADIMKSLSEYGFIQVDFRSLSGEEEQYLQAYFNSEILPLISPQVIDKRHPFPFLKNKEIYAAVSIEGKNSTAKVGIIPASGNFSRLIFLPDNKRFMLVEELILHYVGQVFGNYKIIDKTLFRVTRNADINVEEALDHDLDFRQVMEELLKKRKKLSPVRLELSRNISQSTLDYLCENLELSAEQVFRIKSPLDLSFVFPLRDKIAAAGCPIFYNKAEPQKSLYVNHHEPMIKQILKKDMLLFYPYESIRPFIRLLNEAAEDENVVSVKITLYRVAKNSKIVEALVNMAENGKDVMVLVELRARFDEENNIGWSKRLEEAGCRVIYGPEDLKVHSKLLLITRKNGSKVEHITQIGTGNYNEKTSNLYTDLSLMTADENIANEAAQVFNALALGNLAEDMKHLLVAPKCLQNRILDMIDEEIAVAKSGQPAYLGFKLNSLTDKIIMDKLVEASQAGVRIDLIVRGICCLVAGVPGYTENISIISVVGRYLEHSRIYIFGTKERCKLYISSADFMTRNTLRRVEVAAPVYDKDIKARILDMFSIILSDNMKARRMNSNGEYVRREVVGMPIDSQEYFIKQAYDNAAKIPQTTQKKKGILISLKKFLSGDK